MHKGLQGLWALVGWVHENAAYEIYSIRRRATAEYLIPRMRADLWEFKLSVVGVHRADLVFRGCSQNFDDLHKLVYAAFPWE